MGSVVAADLNDRTERGDDDGGRPRFGVAADRDDFADRRVDDVHVFEFGAAGPGDDEWPLGQNAL